MELKRLDIVNYKNIKESRVECSSGFNCFIGNNGMGKTNILDAVYHLSMCKSYFNLSDGQNIRHGETFFVLQGSYVRDGEEMDIYCGVKQGQKKVFKKNKKSYERLSEHIGLLPLVMISPADTVLIEGGSEERRRFVDGVISQCDKEYLHQLIRHNRIVMQRNSLFKEHAGRPLDGDMVAVWDEQLAEAGKVILDKRQQFMQEFGERFQYYYDQITTGKERVSLSYVTTIREGDILKSLHDTFSRDRLLMYTTVGVHRDDIVLELEGYPVKRLGSQGQKKSFLAALKFAQFSYLAGQKGVKPLLLLDDIFDKLDEERVKQIIQLVSGDTFGQVFITDTNREHVDEILRSHTPEYRIYEVNRGEVQAILR